MPSADCPSCHTYFEFDFQIIACIVWFPTCQIPFSPPVASGTEPPNAEQIDMSNKRVRADKR